MKTYQMKKVLQINSELCAFSQVISMEIFSKIHFLSDQMNLKVQNFKLNRVFFPILYLKLD